MLSVVDELFLNYQMALTLYYVPTAAESWIELNKEVDSSDELDQVKLQVAGMPLLWKVLSATFILAPKLLIWKMTIQTGIMFLMETPTIDNIIVNSVALAFILSIDEMICGNMMSEPAKAMLNKLEELQIFDDMEDKSEQQLVEDHSMEETITNLKWKEVIALIPHKLIIVVLLTMLGIWEYYYANCRTTAEGHRVSLDVALPKSVDFNFLNAFFPRLVPLETEADPFWTMPEV